ncbi:hypothetical protein [Mycobacterium conspicuum]|uniref:Uncharacterized protein n=1 Tax=Mycobacterium conspicuum TaxID=44010 RepID=A0A1X1T6E8_9MYCO|nr:hypothetical protein AWC00_16880 [Mycobacterium conspicuum]BBZ42317.1 hypothetical protein MCNS_53800 [Mycobacterium conspicuum]
MSYNSAVSRSNGRYGPVTFVVAQLHILITTLPMWLLFPYSMVFVLPIVLVYLALSALISISGGTMGQVGRGMLIGSLAGPLSLAVLALAA